VQLDWSLLAAFALLWLAIVPTPGPNTLLIVHLALAGALRDVALALAGNLLAVAGYALATLFGLSLLLAAAPSVRLGVYLLGGAYLVRAGLALGWAGRSRLRAGIAGAQLAPQTRSGTPFRQGVLTALANVQALFFLTSIFASAGILTASAATQAAAVASIVLLNGAYLALLACLLQRQGPRAVFARFRPAMEIGFGVLFVAFGLRLIGREVGGWL
jgi:threonine/homoserine/homoserine lactone efflux protein